MNKKPVRVVDVADMPFTTLSPADQTQLNHHLRRKPLSKGAFYFLPPLPQVAYLLPLSGTMLWRKEHPKKTMPFLFPLPVGGLWRIPCPHGNDVFPFVEAAETGVLGVLSEAGFEALCRHSPDLCLSLISSMTLTLNQLEDEFYQRATSQLNARLARLLLAQHELYKGQVIVFQTHKYLGNLLGTNRENVTVLLGKFKREGWVTLAPQRITLMNMPALEKMAQAY